MKRKQNSLLNILKQKPGKKKRKVTKSNIPKIPQHPITAIGKSIFSSLFPSQKEIQQQQPNTNILNKSYHFEDEKCVLIEKEKINCPKDLENDINRVFSHLQITCNNSVEEYISSKDKMKDDDDDDDDDIFGDVEGEYVCEPSVKNENDEEEMEEEEEEEEVEIEKKKENYLNEEEIKRLKEQINNAKNLMKNIESDKKRYKPKTGYELLFHGEKRVKHITFEEEEDLKVFNVRESGKTNDDDEFEKFRKQHKEEFNLKNFEKEEKKKKKKRKKKSMKSKINKQISKIEKLNKTKQNMGNQAKGK